MLKSGLSIQICFLHVFTTAGCCRSMFLLTLSVAATFISKGTSKVVQGNTRKMSRAEYIKLKVFHTTFSQPALAILYYRLYLFTAPQFILLLFLSLTSSRQPP